MEVFHKLWIPNIVITLLGIEVPKNMPENTKVCSIICGVFKTATQLVNNTSYVANKLTVSKWKHKSQLELTNDWLQ